MKTKSLFLSIAGAFLLMFAFSSCTKEGPQGPPGVDANATCTECHTVSTSLYAKIIQYEASTHKNGGNFERSTASCAGCHTHEGFIQRLELDSWTIDDVVDPTPPNCRTCHKIHETYTADDYELRQVDPVEFLFDPTKTVDAGIGNSCAVCHQPRALDPPLPAVGSATVVNTSNKRWGYHHGPQGALLAGVGAYEVPGSVAYPTSASAHLATGCTTCHMGVAFGDQAGGHTFGMTYEYHGSDVGNVAVCTDCHSTATDLDYHGVQTEVQGLLDSLASMLDTRGVLVSGYFVTNTDVTALRAGAYLNYQFLLEDRSLGVHSPAYTLATLKNTIEALNNE